LFVVITVNCDCDRTRRSLIVHTKELEELASYLE
jgi:hypothetical protein